MPSEGKEIQFVLSNIVLPCTSSVNCVTLLCYCFTKMLIITVNKVKVVKINVYLVALQFL